MDLVKTNPPFPQEHKLRPGESPAFFFEKIGRSGGIRTHDPFTPRGGFSPLMFLNLNAHFSCG